MRSGKEIEGISEEIAKPFCVQHEGNRIVSITYCPFCGQRNYFIQIIKDNGGKTWSDDYARCEHYLRAEARKIGSRYRKVAVYTAIERGEEG